MKNVTQFRAELALSQAQLAHVPFPTRLDMAISFWRVVNFNYMGSYLMLRKKGSSCPLLVTSTEFVLWYGCIEQGVNKHMVPGGAKKLQNLLCL